MNSHKLNISIYLYYYLQLLTMWIDHFNDIEFGPYVKGG